MVVVTMVDRTPEAQEMEGGRGWVESGDGSGPMLEAKGRVGAGS